MHRTQKEKKKKSFLKTKTYFFLLFLSRAEILTLEQQPPLNCMTTAALMISLANFYAIIGCESPSPQATR
jgi:hypothetical protein